MNKENIIITGASSGVGKMLVSKLKKEYNVITISRRIDKIISNNHEVFAYKYDLSNTDGLADLTELILREHGSVYNIINCAGVLTPGVFNDDLIKDIEYSIKVNALAPMQLISYFLPNMIKHDKGTIINLTSGAPLNCFAGYSCYSASKSLLNSMTVTLSKELEKTNISVNLMSPGPVRSEMSPDADLEPEICFPTVRYLLDGKGKNEHNYFYWLGYKVPLFPKLDGIDWLNGNANGVLEKVL